MNDIVNKIRAWLYRKTRYQIFRDPFVRRLSKFEPPRNFDDLVRMMESCIPIGIGTDYATSITGLPYKEFALGIFMPDEEKRIALVQAFWWTFIRQIELDEAPEKTVLYWRIKPEMAAYEDGRKERIYMRYLVTSSPAIYSPHGDFHLGMSQ